jgi:serpin B
MATAPTSALLDALERYRLLEAAQLEELKNVQSRFPDPRALAGELIRRGWLSGLREEEVIVALPRFRITREFNLAKTLAVMGMSLAFGDQADFSGMDGKKDLYISEVFHKAFVDVNEGGTEAAATAVMMKAGRAESRIVPLFRADHPFVFLIRDRASGSILFMGRVVNPEK